MDQPEPEHKMHAADAQPSATTQGSTSDNAPTGYAKTGKSISVWTTNLLATAVVVILAIVTGSHLTASFGTLADQSEDPSLSTELAQAWPTLESCAIQFGDLDLELQRDSLLGSRDEVTEFMRARCRAILEQNKLTVGDPGEAESSLVKKLLKSQPIEPVEQVPGKWRIFQIENTELNSPLPLVIGLRDDIGDEAQSGRQESRLAVWGLAIPAGPTDDTNGNTNDNFDNPKTLRDNGEDLQTENQRWTSYVGRTVGDDRLNKLKVDLIPKASKRTLVVAGPNGGSLIGFSGGDLNQTTRFFDQLAIQRSWKTKQPWRQTGRSWSASYELPPDSSAKGIQVQLHVNHNQPSPAQTLRGMLVIQSQ